MAQRIGIFLIIVILISALLTPLVCEIFLLFYSPLPFPFSRIFDRVILVVAGLGIFFARKKFAINFESAGFLKKMSLWQECLKGLLLTLVSGILLIGILVLQSQLVFKNVDPSYLWRKIPFLLPLALFISLIEEYFFRGFLFQKLKSNFTVLGAMICTSLLYAAVHFLSPVKAFEYSSGSLHLGFVYLYVVIQRIFDIGVLPGLFGLFLVGMALSDIVRRCGGSLSLAIGMHAGWIISLKLVAYLLEAAPGIFYPEDLGQRYFIVGNSYGWSIIILVWLVAWFYTKSNLKNQRNI
jgi:uncharacterized protein